MVNSISNYNNVNQINSVQKQDKPVADSNFVAKNVTTTTPISGVYVPIEPKKAVKVGEVKIPYANNAQVYKLANGQKLVALNKKGPTTINTFVKVGSFNEPDNLRGISHYIEHNLFNGSSNLKQNEFVEKVSSMGGNYNASTGFKSTNYYIKSPLHNKSDLDKMLKMHSNMLEAPLFSVDTLEKEKGIVCSEIQMLEDRPYLKAENILLKNLFGIETDSTDLIGGNVSNIQNLNKNTVTDFYNKHYTPDNMTTVIVGDINPDEVANKLNKLFISRRPKSENIEHEPLKPIEKTVRKDIENPNIHSSIVNMGFIGPKGNDVKSRVALQALFIALSGHENAKLTKDLEPFNTDASIYRESLSNNADDPVAIMLEASFSDGEEDAGLKQIYSSIHKMKYEPVSDKELKNIKRDLKSNFKYVSESSMGLTNLLGSAQLNGDLNDINKSYELIDKLTSKDIMDAAKYLDLNKTSIVVLHPKKEDSNISFSGTKKFHSDAIEKFDIGKTESYTLKNNMEVNYLHTDAPFSASTIYVKHDNLKETTPGVSLVLSSMLKMGSAYNDKDTFYEQVNDKDLSLNVSANSDGLIAVAMGENENLQDGINLSKEVMFAPRFTKENLEKAKSEIKLAYEGSTKSPFDKGLEELYEGNTDYISMEKCIDNLDNITLSDVSTFYSKIMQGGEAKAVITSSNENKTKALQNLQSTPWSFKTYDIDTKSDATPLTKSKVVVQAEDRNQAALVQMYKVDQSNNVKDTASMMMLNKILGGSSASRLFMDLREEQKLAYSVKSRYNPHGKDKRLQMSILTTTQDSKNGLTYHHNIEKAIEGFKKHTDALMTNPVSDEELNEAKLTLLSDFPYAAESTAGKHSLVASGADTIYGPSYSKELAKAIQEVTPSDIQKMAKHVFKQNSVISMVANKDTIDANKEYLATKGELKLY